MTSKLTVTVGQFSDKGLKPVNQDCYGLITPEDRLLENKGIAIAIADGISSSEYGQEASHACIKGFLEDYYSTPDSWSVKKSAHQVLITLNNWLYSQGKHREQAHCGRVSTLSILVLKSTTAHIIHIGDSRIYRLRHGELEQLTIDHKTWVSKDRNYLSRAMGADTHLEIDYSKQSIEAGDIFILSTDGVHEHISEETMIRHILENKDNLDKSAELMARDALADGSEDNVTCQVLSVDCLPSQDPDDVFQELTELPFPPELNEGMIIDGFRIVREIHATKRTQMYLAIDTETGLNVALKTPSVNFEDDPAYIERFILEEWIGRRIDNPHVVKVYIPTRRRRFLYHVTEYLENTTLRQWMLDHPQPKMDEVRKIIEQIAKGLRAF
ncbi:MAG: protein phosphatase 2C domain-containing protein [Gammaproteobacteria bacterium]|nr:protein phosphatase 2C domain-containing protein [Gammaproteobacteria bacterium]